MQVSVMVWQTLNNTAMNSQMMNDKTLIALEVVTQLNFVETNNKLPNEYKGYISSFGASVGQAGLLPAVLFYSEKGNDTTKTRRIKLMNALLTLIKTYNSTRNVEDWQNDIGIKVSTNLQSGDYKLLEYVKTQNYSIQCANEVLEAGIALKLAFRAFATPQ
jgi:CRISPR/Cas system CMR-associated protein Cmr5 small subunit